MKKSEFTLKYKLSSRTPQDPSIHNYSVFELAATIRQFLMQTFDGTAEVESTVTQYDVGFISVCTDYVTFFFKELISHAGGEELLYINIETVDDNKISISIESEIFAKLSTPHLREIIKCARNTGFSVISAERGLLLQHPYKKHAAYSLHASSDKTLLERFHEMFFTELEDISDTEE